MLLLSAEPHTAHHYIRSRNGEAFLKAAMKSRMAKTFETIMASPPAGVQITLSQGSN